MRKIYIYITFLRKKDPSLSVTAMCITIFKPGLLLLNKTITTKKKFFVKWNKINVSVRCQIYKAKTEMKTIKNTKIQQNY